MSGVLALVLAVLTYLNVHGSLMGDETFSLALVQHSWGEMISLAMEDVHPPVYYMILKVCTDLLGRGDPVRAALAGKLASMLPLWILYVLAATTIRKDYGRRVSILFALFVIGLPSLIHIASYIRMYSWGMLFVTVSGLMAARIMRRQDTGWTWGIFFVSSVAACYTHYFCDAAIFYIYVLLLLWMIRYRRESVRVLLIQAAVVVLSFLPWMAVLAGQVGAVAEDYWIEEIDAATILDYCKFFLSPYTNASMIRIPLALLMVAIIAYAFVIALRAETRRLDAVCLMAVVLCVIVTGVVVSWVFRPIFVARYAVPSSGLFCLGLATVIAGGLPEDLRPAANTRAIRMREILAMGSVLVLAAISAINILSFSKNERSYARSFDSLEENLLHPVQEAAASGDTVAILVDSDSLDETLAYLMPEATIYCVGFEPTDYFCRLAAAGNIKDDPDASTVSADVMWFVHAVSSDDEWLPANVAEKEGISAMIEQSGIMIYRMDQ